MSNKHHMSGEQLAAAAKVLETLAPAPKLVVAEPPREYQCQGCGAKNPIGKMQRITGSRLAPQVVDILCLLCWKEHPVECRKLSRVICLGCKEVVGAYEPHKEKTGYVWQPGGFSHIARCPICTKDEELKFKPSPVAEKIAFYKANGIPYES